MPEIAACRDDPTQPLIASIHKPDIASFGIGSLVGFLPKLFAADAHFLARIQPRKNFEFDSQRGRNG
jgi:hypothetical protein